MINGAHILLYSQNPDADRAFFRDVLSFPYVDVGHGWLIFKLPPSEVAVHPGDSAERHAGHTMLGAVLYLMCDDLASVVEGLERKQVACTGIETESWGIRTTVTLPSGGDIGLYQPRHARATDL